MIEGARVLSHQSVLHHIDDSRELTLFVRSVVEARPEVFNSICIHGFRKIVADLVEELDERYGPGLTIELLDAQDMDNEADEFTDDILMLITSKHNKFQLQ